MATPKQLPEIATGGLFAALVVRQPCIELRDNRRQREEWERAALSDPRDGDTGRALAMYNEHGRITIGEDADGTKRLLVADSWASQVQGEDAVMLAGRRSEVAELNVRGRLRALDAGWLNGPTLDVNDVAFQAGDAVMMLRNNRKLGVRNGNRGTVIDVDPNEQSLRVSLARGQVTLPAAYLLAGNVGHAYAMTVNKAHGMTCDRTMTLATTSSTANSPTRRSAAVDCRTSCTYRARASSTSKTARTPAPQNLPIQWSRWHTTSNNAEPNTSPSTRWPRCRSPDGRPATCLPNANVSEPSSTRPHQTVPRTSQPSQIHDGKCSRSAAIRESTLQRWSVAVVHSVIVTSPTSIC